MGMGFNTISWSNDLNDLGVRLWLRNPIWIHYILQFWLPVIGKNWTGRSWCRGFRGDRPTDESSSRLLEHRGHHRVICPWNMVQTGILRMDIFHDMGWYGYLPVGFLVLSVETKHVKNPTRQQHYITYIYIYICNLYIYISPLNWQ